jgi:endonuclease/exonuclease/phosphatase family metal-dependent hydrolase
VTTIWNHVLNKTILVAAIAVLNLSACTDRERGTPDEHEKIELRVMTFNIEWGGMNISFDNVVEAIRLSGADIVGIQEAEGNLPRLAAELGWHYNLPNYAISKFPLLDAPNANRLFVLVEVRPGQVVALANVHLPSDPSGTELVRDGGMLEEVIELEKTARLESLKPYLDVLAPVVSSNTPVFLTGDFNAPSHADWKEDMVGARPFLRYSVDWPVSRAVENAGFKDSWRVVYPNTKTDPGLTWWADRPPLDNYAPGKNDPQDRIDFVWFAGAAEALSSNLIGENGAQNVTLSVSPWPSDHRAVVSTFSVNPAAVPRLVNASRRIYDLDDDVVIVYRQAQQSDIEIIGVSSDVVSGSGELRFPAGTLSSGHYNVTLRTPESETLDSDFWVVDSNAKPTVSLSRDTYEVGQAIDIDWWNGPGNRNDYLGIYEIGVKPDYDPDYDGGLTWLYINALPEGTIRLDETTSQVVWPLPPGTYVARLMKDDGYEVLVESAPFDIR